MLVSCVCLHAYYLLFLLSALDSNDTESIEEGKVYGYQGEDQGQADQGKPSIYCISESYQVTMHCSTLALITMHCFSYIAINP
jgi:hypothetical protein